MDKELKKELDQWVTENYKWISGQIRTKIAKDQMAQFADDLISHMFVELYRMKEPKLRELLDNGKLKWYILTGAGIQLRSSTSKFYLVHRKERMQSRENYGHNRPGRESAKPGILERPYEPYEDELYECFMESFDSLHWYLKEIMNKYWLEGWSLTQIYKHYNISKTHLVTDINSAINQIRTKCSQC